MNKSIHIIASMLIVMLINSTSIAQSEKEKGIKEVAEIQTRRMEVKLNLSEDQFLSVMRINLKFMKDLQEALRDRDNETLLTEARIMRSVSERNDAFVEILSEDQMSDFLLIETDRMFARNRGRLN